MLSSDNLILIKSVLAEMETPIIAPSIKNNNISFNSVSFEFKRTISLSDKDKHIFSNKSETGETMTNSSKVSKNKPGWKKIKSKPLIKSNQFQVISSDKNSFDFFSCMLYSILFSYLVFLEKKIKTSYTEKRNYRMDHFKYFLIGFNVFCKKERANIFFQKTSLMYLSANLIPYMNNSKGHSVLIAKNLDVINQSGHKSDLSEHISKSLHHTNVFYAQLVCNNLDNVHMPKPYQKLIHSEFNTQFLVHASSKNLTHNNQSISMLTLNGLKFI